MKLSKALLLIITLAFISSNAYAAKNCDEIKQNIVGKMLCKAGANIEGNASASSATTTKEEKKGWKIWKKPEWMKKKN